MPEQNYKPNSYKSKEEAERESRAPVAKGRKREKSELEKAASSFFAEDIKTVRNSVIEDVIIPRVKKLFSESIKTRVDIFFYGKSTPTPTGSNISSRIRYNTVSKNRPAYSGYSQRQSYDYGEVILPYPKYTREDRENIVRLLDDIINTYGCAKVADLYEFRDIPTEHTDFKYGWTDIRGYSISRTGYGSDAGWLIKMPRVMPV